MISAIGAVSAALFVWLLPALNAQIKRHLEARPAAVTFTLSIRCRLPTREEQVVILVRSVGEPQQGAELAVDGRGLTVEYRVGNALELPFPDASFDVVISSRLLWTLTEPDAAVREWARVLVPGGVLIAINELEPGEGIRLSPLDDYRAKARVDELPFANADIDDILAALASAGLLGARMQHLPGCHLAKRDRENWFAFVATKAAVHP